MTTDTATPIFDQLASEVDFDVQSTLERDYRYPAWKAEFDAGWPERWRLAKGYKELAKDPEVKAERPAKKAQPRKTAAKKPR